jgi:hypothetical protein
MLAPVPSWLWRNSILACGLVMHQLGHAIRIGMMLMPDLIIGSSPIATNQTYYLGPSGHRADIVTPSHSRLERVFYSGRRQSPSDVM